MIKRISADKSERVKATAKAKCGGLPLAFAQGQNDQHFDYSYFLSASFILFYLFDHCYASAFDRRGGIGLTDGQQKAPLWRGFLLTCCCES